jgi:hypothetical protein
MLIPRWSENFYPNLDHKYVSSRSRAFKSGPLNLTHFITILNSLMVMSMCIKMHIVALILVIKAFTIKWCDLH